MSSATNPHDGLEINGVAHVIFRVNNIARCIAFYDQLHAVSRSAFDPAPDHPLSGRPLPEDWGLVELHPLATGFANVADAYERGRPEYSQAVVSTLVDELKLQPDATVLDLAAGTGKLTRALLAAGLDVVAVEPQKEMREALAARVGDERVLDGVAEEIPLANESVAAVTVGEAFHWFDAPRALAEIRRVLIGGGGLALLSAIPDWRDATWGHDLGELVGGLRPAHPKFDRPPWQEEVRADGHWSEPREIRLTAPMATDIEQLVAYVASISWIASLPDGEHEATLTRARELISKGQTPEELPVHIAIGLTTLLSGP